MFSKRHILVISLLLVVAVLFSVPAWGQMMKLNEAPMLAEMVKAGTLPPVDERLPEKPFVRQVFNEIGQYGGTLRKWTTSPREAFFMMLAYLGNTDAGGWGFDTPFDINEYAERGFHFNGHDPFHYESYEYNDDFTEVTMRLRKGIKWSDGHPFTADDIVWSQYKILTKVPEVWPFVPWFSEHLGENLEVEKIDDLTVKWKASAPHPRMHIVTPLYLINVFPKHYFEKFHPEDNPNATYEELRLRAGLPEGMDMSLLPEQPQLGPWVYTRIDSTEGVWATRNPYYPVVDPEGNQLPYIDHVRIKIFSDEQAGILSTIQGETDVQGTHHGNLANFQLLKENEAKGNYQVLVWRGGASQGYYLVNVDTNNEQLAKYLRQFDFRKAMSLALNREEINEALYFGLAETSGTAVGRDSAFYDEKMNMWGRYDPDEARRLLAGLGLKDTDGDGLVNYPGGDNLVITLNHASNLRPNIPLGELAVKYWKDVGIDVRQKVVQAKVIFEARTSNDVEMYSNWGPSGQVYMPWISTGTHAGAYMGSGIEDPPAEYVKMWAIGTQAKTAPDAESLFEAVKEFWNVASSEVLQEIFVTSSFPIPIIRHNRIGNVPDVGLSTGEQHAYPEQFYIKQ